MRFYNRQHQYYCGIDLHARHMYVCILDQNGETMVHRNIRTDPKTFLTLIQPYRQDLVVGVECLFCWYWVSDFCVDHDITFTLGHALYMKAVHGAKTKNDRIDSHKIAALLRAGMFPMAYVYPREMRPTRDLLRRRMHFVRRRAELMAHIKNTVTQYNLPPLRQRVDRKNSRAEGLLEHFGDDIDVQMSMAADASQLDAYDVTIHEMELYLVEKVQEHNAADFALLRTIPGIGKILGLTLIYEIQDIRRFPQVGSFLSYARLVPGSRESDGKRKKSSGRKMGNAHLKWAFSEAAALYLCNNPRGKNLFQRLQRKHSKGKAMSVLAARLGRAAYFMLQRRQPFNESQFVKA